MPSVVIQSLAADGVTAAAGLLAASMVDNPLHQRVFMDDAARVEPLLAETFTHLLHRQIQTGCVLAAREDDILLGVAAMVPPGHCRLGPAQKLSMLWPLLRHRGLRHLPRIQRWLHQWVAQDPPMAHWHLGPAAVVRARQGQGVGSALMAAVCEKLDRCAGTGYLETDKADNVRLYRRGGFEVIAERDVLGVRNWFMLRPARVAPATAGP